jgi:NitT/TauT family transport system ATP-binding protein
MAPPVHPRPAIELQDASVVFGAGEKAVTALAPTSLRMARGDFLALVGPSGCGKSTILRLVSNLLQPSLGLVLVGGKAARAKALRIGMAFQNPTMLPWLTIEQNVMMPLKIVPPFKQNSRRDRKGVFRDRVHALLSSLGLTTTARRPSSRRSN